MLTVRQHRELLRTEQPIIGGNQGEIVDNGGSCKKWVRRILMGKIEAAALDRHLVV